MLQKYAPTLFSAAVTVLGGLQVLVQKPTDLVTILQFVALLATTATTFQLPTKGKLLAEWAGVVVAAVLPFAIDHTVTWATLILILIAVTKAGATHLGVVIRSDVPSASVKIMRGSITAESIASNAITAEKIKSDAVKARDLHAPVDEVTSTGEESLNAEPGPVGANGLPFVHNDGLDEPKKSAKLVDWIAFAEQFGYNPHAKLTRQALVEQYGAKP